MGRERSQNVFIEKPQNATVDERKQIDELIRLNKNLFEAQIAVSKAGKKASNEVLAEFGKCSTELANFAQGLDNKLLKKFADTNFSDPKSVKSLILSDELNSGETTLQRDSFNKIESFSKDIVSKINAELTNLKKHYLANGHAINQLAQHSIAFNVLNDVAKLNVEQLDSTNKQKMNK